MLIRIIAGGLLIVALAHRSQGADDPIVRDVWPGETVGDFGKIGPERVRTPDDAPTRTAKWITNVTRPTITVFRAPRETATGAAVLICPGGGYWNLAIDLEGEEVAAWLNRLGITGVVLKYRVPRRQGQPEPLPAPGPALDAQRAMRLVRANAKEWGIDSDRIGIMGFSAGGHLAATTATNFDRNAYIPIDAIDGTSSRPNFAVIVYPGYLVPEDQDTEVLANFVRFPEQTPPMFLVHASDDPESSPANSVSMYRALRRAGIPAELHVYGVGGHGFGVRKSGRTTDGWTRSCEAWFREQAIIGFASSSRNPLEPDGDLPTGDHGIAARHPGDRGIEGDPRVLFHDDFERTRPGGTWDNVYHAANLRLAAEQENVHSGKRALEFRVPKQDAEVSNEVVKHLEGRHDVVFLRYYSKFDSEFDQVGSSHNGGYLAAITPGIPYATPGVPADGRNKFVASFECWRGEKETASPGQLNIYCYHPAQRSQWGDHFFPSGKVLPNSSLPGDFGDRFTSRPEITPELGRWTCYEFMMKANTVGRRDGRIACWVDGQLVADFSNLRLRDDENLKINHAALVLHIGSNPTRENRKWYDDVVIATSYIGPRIGDE